MDSEDDIDIETMFQYISCCSLSTSPIFFTIKLTRFNTSHVVVYLRFPNPKFNYAGSFQYISCCSLSLIVEHITLKKLSFNTSHVVVYHM